MTDTVVSAGTTLSTPSAKNRVFPPNMRFAQGTDATDRLSCGR